MAQTAVIQALPLILHEWWLCQLAWWLHQLGTLAYQSMTIHLLNQQAPVMLLESGDGITFHKKSEYTLIACVCLVLLSCVVVSMLS